MDQLQGIFSDLFKIGVTVSLFVGFLAVQFVDGAICEAYLYQMTWPNP